MDDRTKPVLPGVGSSDYERYLRTDELLSLQKAPAERVDRDELLFQVVHQSAELWLKLAGAEIADATALLDVRDLGAAVRLLRRAVATFDHITPPLHMLEQMSPWEYQAIRRVLGHGSGFDSPGFRQILALSPALYAAFERRLLAQGLTLVELYRRGREQEALYQVAELLIGWDEAVMLWRYHHLKLVQRIIGGHVIGTQGTPVEVLAQRIDRPLFPALWAVRDELTAAAERDVPSAARPGDSSGGGNR